MHINVTSCILVLKSAEKNWFKESQSVHNSQAVSITSCPIGKRHGYDKVNVQGKL